MRGFFSEGRKATMASRGKPRYIVSSPIAVLLVIAIKNLCLYVHVRVLKEKKARVERWGNSRYTASSPIAFFRRGKN